MKEQILIAALTKIAQNPDILDNISLPNINSPTMSEEPGAVWTL